jgi:hypothetical protein
LTTLFKCATVLLFLAFLFIQAGGSHIGGPLIMFALIGLFSSSFLIAVVPFIGLLFLMLPLFANKKYHVVFFIIGMSLLYLTIGVVMAESNANERQKSMVTILPFIALSVVTSVLLVQHMRLKRK